MNRFCSLFSGLIFGLGLTISGMTNPEKVINFLNVARSWDPSLAFVMIGAILVSAPFFYLVKNKNKPLFAESFSWPTLKEIDSKLIIGSLLFGVGWGLIGLCPGPAIASISLIHHSSFTFILAMLAGFSLVRAYNLIN